MPPGRPFHPSRHCRHFPRVLAPAWHEGLINGCLEYTEVTIDVIEITAMEPVPKWNRTGALMRIARIALVSLLLSGPMPTQVHSVSFVVFPKAERLVSPDGRFLVEGRDREAASSQYVGTFHSLWLTEVATGRSRKLFDYIGLAAVAWSGNDFVVITEYVSKRTSRALVFPVVGPGGPIVLDVSTLIQMVAVEWRDTLRADDHIFVEAVQLERETFYFRVWGYGQHDANGFHWKCEYSMLQDKVSCRAGNQTTFEK